MKLKNIFILITVLTLSCAAISPLPLEAKSSKAGTSQSASSKKSKKSKSSDKESSSKKSKKKSRKSDDSNASSSKSSKKNKSSKQDSSSKSSKQKKDSGSSSDEKKKSRKSKQTTAAPAPKPSSTQKTTKFTNASDPAPEKQSNDSITLVVNREILKVIPEQQNPGGLRVNSVIFNDARRSTEVKLNENFTYLPISQQLINNMNGAVKRAVPDSVRNYKISLTVGKHNLSYYTKKIDKLPEKYRNNEPFVVSTDPYARPSKGMENDVVAMWHSHGRYFKNGGWAWQRPLLFETLEDIYTMSYILPYVVPMLENAGAYVMLPRERDVNKHEVIVDNDTNVDGDLYSQPYYKEQTGGRKWETGEKDGFIYDLRTYRDTENPFETGTYRQTRTIKNGKPSVAAWYADIPQNGEYAVYISYKSLPNSTKDAKYTVNFSGGSREFSVNQTMGGGTWIYLGTFPFEEGYSDVEPVVTLTNVSSEADKIVTADAIKIGGGMGNIERSTNRRDVTADSSAPIETDEDISDEDVDAQDYAADKTPVAPKGSTARFSTSGLPRFLEGARYWMHWAGAPESVYSPYHGRDDYKDDYTGRGHWVNWLAGGSRVLPGKEGLHIPVDVTVALHSDAGKRSDDSIVGTLGIYYTNGGASYTDGTPRMNSRQLTDMLMQQITGDIRKTFEPKWTRRSMWDKSYLEARVPEVPTALIELMSHQNFGDMQYGLDPSFRFTVGRAMYKAIGRFVSERKGREFIVQPLPVKDFSIVRKGKKHYSLSWQPTPDPLESTAMPKKYIIFERSQNVLGFRKIAETSSTHYDVKINDNEIHSFKIVAANDGGLSFPSEILAMREAPDEKQPILIINGFTRVSAPGIINSDGRAGFDSEKDFGVPYVRDISFSGHQHEFRRGAGDSFGRSNSNYIQTVIAGNTFDYPYIHGISIANAGFGFVSISLGAVENGSVRLSDYKTVDLILGRQKATTVGKGSSGVKFRAFPPELQKNLETFINKGGNLMVSGEYVVSDLYGEKASENDRKFAREILGVEPAENAESTRSGKVRTTVSNTPGVRERTLQYSNTLNESQYIVQTPDALETVDPQARELLEFTDSDAPAGWLSKKGSARRAVLSIPFESFTDQAARDALMKEILNSFGR
ncbi:MAG: xanthan lyase [Muribaculaceae bacterium]|nr:xanthan lyase [Muribaculaceae bacterium]